MRKRKKEVIDYSKLLVNIASVFSSALISVFLAFAIYRPTEIIWISFLITISVIYILVVYFCDIYMSKEPILLS